MRIILEGKTLNYDTASLPTSRKSNLIHKLWTEVSNIPTRHRVKHRDVVRVALDRLGRDLHRKSDAILDFHNLEHRDGQKSRDDAK